MEADDGFHEWEGQQQEDDRGWTVYLENYKGFRTSASETGAETNTYILHHLTVVYFGVLPKQLWINYSERLGFN